MICLSRLSDWGTKTILAQNAGRAKVGSVNIIFDNVQSYGHVYFTYHFIRLDPIELDRDCCRIILTSLVPYQFVRTKYYGYPLERAVPARSFPT